VAVRLPALCWREGWLAAVQPAKPIRGRPGLPCGLGPVRPGFHRGAWPAGTEFELFEVYGALSDCRGLAGYEVARRFYESGGQVSLPKRTHI